MFLPKAGLRSMKWLNIPNAFISFLLSKELLSQLEYSAFGTRWSLPIITHGLAPVLNRWREITEMLLSVLKEICFKEFTNPQHTSLHIRNLTWKTRYSQPFPVSVILYSGLQKPVGFISVGSWEDLDSDSLPCCLRMDDSETVKWIRMKCFTLNHWVFYNVFIRRGYL